MNRVPGSLDRKLARRAAIGLAAACVAPLMALALLSSAARAQGNPWVMPQQPTPWHGAQQPSYPNYQRGYPNYEWRFPQKAKPQTAQRAAPTLRIKLKSSEAYVHQGLVLTLEMASTGNLKNLAIKMPRSDDVIIRDLDTRSAHAEKRGGKRMIVNVLHYHLVPLKPGKLELEPVKVSGEHVEGGRFAISSGASLELKILPPPLELRPWLPLRQLELSARLIDDDRISSGKPLTLIVEQRSIGMVGAQLPSPERQLKAGDYKLYREDTSYEALISTDGHLNGKRIDRFTLVPLRSGILNIPEISVSWWNVERRRKEQAIIPGRRLLSADAIEEPRPAAAPGLYQQLLTKIDLDQRWFWGALVALAFLAGLGWRYLGGALRGIDKQLFGNRIVKSLRAGREHVGVRLAHAWAPVREGLLTVAYKLSPRRLYHRARTFVANTLPKPLRLWFCVRTVQLETNPEDWASVLRFVLHRRLGLSAQQPMGQLAAQIAELHPGSDRQRLEQLLRQLDAANFGRVPIGDFERWKRAFMREIRPHPWTWIRAANPAKRRSRLPTLNPEL